MNVSFIVKVITLWSVVEIERTVNMTPPLRSAEPHNIFASNNMSHTFFLLWLQLLNIWKRVQLALTSCVHTASAKLLVNHNSETAQKINVIVSNVSFSTLIGPVEILLERSRSMGEIPHGTLRGDENRAELHRKAIARPPMTTSFYFSARSH